ncbi:MAG: 4Fe-4S dicluster domain-containing protein [Deferribacteraceae bacterium]|jgi:Fe-S-cluster-containing dehydrogenase component|nr:4Fe-4S dicluster domain-containing protein [Deferribacteraceae bacterium]
MKLGMLIRTDRCIGCQTCVITCKVNKMVPGEQYYSRVETQGNEMYVATKQPDGKVTMKFIPQNCNHCEEPKCAAACPVGAIGINELQAVYVDRMLCDSVAACVAACPYGNITLDSEYNKAAKCDFCSDRVLNGEEPYCVLSCPTKARIIGDLDDPESAVSQIIRNENATVLKPEENTKPKVYYTGLK